MRRRLVQLVDEVFEVLQAALADLPEVLPEGHLQTVLQVGVFGHQHFHHHSEGLAVPAVHLKARSGGALNTPMHGKQSPF